MTRLHIPALLTAAALAVFSSPALAQGRCASAEAVMEIIVKNDERPRFRAVSPNGQHVFVLWHDPADGSWTATVRNSQGVMCVTAAGMDGGEFVPETAKKEAL